MKSYQLKIIFFFSKNVREFGKSWSDSRTSKVCRMCKVRKKSSAGVRRKVNIFGFIMSSQSQHVVNDVSNVKYFDWSNATKGGNIVETMGKYFEVRRHYRHDVQFSFLFDFQLKFTAWKALKFHAVQNGNSNLFLIFKFDFEVTSKELNEVSSCSWQKGRSSK